MRRIDFKDIIQYCCWNEGDDIDDQLKIKGRWVSPYSIRMLIENTNAIDGHRMGLRWWFFE